MFKRTKLTDGTTGYRFSWGLIRKRAAKKRYGMKTGKTFFAVHAGLRSVYIERKSPVKMLWNFAG